MHSYSVDDENRVRIIIYITILSAIFEMFLVEISSMLANNVTSAILNVIGFPSVFAIMYYCFDKNIWKTKFGRILGVKTPYIAGIWKGQYKSSYCDKDGNPVVGTAELKIKQTWTKILLTSEHAESISESQMAGLFMNNNGNIRLKYQYINNPKNTKKDTMHIHYGFHNLEVKDDVLEGIYFNDNHRKTYGEIAYRKSM